MDDKYSLLFIVILLADLIWIIKSLLFTDRRKSNARKALQPKAPNANEKGYFHQEVTEMTLEAYKSNVAETDKALTKALETTKRANNEDSISYLARCMRESEKDVQQELKGE